MKTNVSKLAPLALIATLALVAVACGPMDEDPGVGSQQQGVTLPPLDTMQINFDLLSQAKQNKQIDAMVKTQSNAPGDSGSGWKFEYKHVTNAIVRSSAAGLVIGIGAIPYTRAYGALLRAGFQWDGKAYVSVATMVSDGGLVALRGVATPELLANEVTLEITRDGKLFTTGASNLAATQGSWTLHAKADGRPVNRIAWTASTATGVDVSGEVIDTTSKYVGTTASIGFSAAGVATLKYDVKPGNGETTVLFNTKTLEGSLQAADYNSGFTGCWDASYKDVACQ